VLNFKNFGAAREKRKSKHNNNNNKNIQLFTKALVTLVSQVEQVLFSNILLNFKFEV